MLSDEAKRSMYDAGLYNPLDDEDEVRIFFVSGFVFLFSVKRCRLVLFAVNDCLGNIIKL